VSAAASGSPGLAGRRTQRHEGHRVRKAAKALSGEKALEGKPQERYPHETGREGSGRRKPSRACETLQAEGVGCGKPEGTGLPVLQALKGTKPVESQAVGFGRRRSGPVRLCRREQAQGRMGGW